MNEKYLLDTITDETLVKLIDETLIIKKTAKSNKTKSALFKIIPAAVMIALVIGLVNLLPALLNNTDIPVDDLGMHAGNPDEIIELFAPDFMKKSFFEEKILAVIPEGRALNRITAYYLLRDPQALPIEHSRDGMIITYSFVHNTELEFYVLDPKSTARERDEILGILREHTDLTGNDIMQMYADSGIIVLETPDPYAHVRFGATRDILLLEVEWHTDDTWLKEAVEPYRAKRDSEEYINGSGRDRKMIDNAIERVELMIDRIAGQTAYIARMINGNHFPEGGISIGYHEPTDISQALDSRGYYTLTVYPDNLFVIYHDENGDVQFETFGIVYNKEEYTIVLEDDVIPFCDEKLAKGWITQEEYDRWTVECLLDFYVDLFFG